MIGVAGQALSVMAKAKEVFLTDKIGEYVLKESPVKESIPTIENVSLDSLKAENEALYVSTRNDFLEGSAHPITGVKFEAKEIMLQDKKIEGVFPEFDYVFETKLPKEFLIEPNQTQFEYCNLELDKAIANNPKLSEIFDTDQLEQIKNLDTPDGYTWHHDAEIGKMQLVDSEIHAKTGHTGGNSLWGFGSINS